jgi:ADP-heptose:LPS heptosyltransferase
MNSVLVIQLKRLGDLLLTTPAIQLLRQAFPEAEITLLSDRNSGALVPAISGIDRSWVYGDTKRLWVKLLKTKFDLSFDFTGNDRSALISFLSKAPRRFGFQFLARRPFRSLAYSHLVQSSVRDKHTVDHYIDLARSVAPFDSDGRIPLRIPDQVRRSVISLSNDLPLRGDYVVLHPGSARAEKYWMTDRWAEVIGHIRKHFALTCIITGGQDPFELRHIDDIIAKSGTPTTVVNLAGKANLLETAVLIEHASFFIGVDTVAAHIAGAFSRPSITLFGMTNPFHWRARHPLAMVLRAGQEGPIRNFDPRQKGASMSELSTETVIHAMELLWKNVKRGKSG